jgi:6-pyruvoyltetrahydropterin/6-carboxytetrahydropterin synthase
LIGIPIDNTDNPKNGMVIDFSDLKTIVRKEIIDIFDHSIVLSKKVNADKTELFKKMFGNLVLVDYQPTCENLVADFAERIAHQIPEEIKLHSLKLYETATSFAEWFAADNDK